MEWSRISSCIERPPPFQLHVVQRQVEHKLCDVPKFHHFYHNSTMLAFPKMLTHSTAPVGHQSPGVSYTCALPCFKKPFCQLSHRSAYPTNRSLAGTQAGPGCPFSLFGCSVSPARPGPCLHVLKLHDDENDASTTTIRSILCVAFLPHTGICAGNKGEAVWRGALTWDNCAEMGSLTFHQHFSPRSLTSVPLPHTKLLPKASAGFSTHSLSYKLTTAKAVGISKSI